MRLRRHAAQDRRGPLRTVRHHPGAASCDGDDLTALCLPVLQRRREAGSGTGTRGSWRPADRAADRRCSDQQVLRSPAAVPPVQDLRPAGRHDQPRTLANRVGRGIAALTPITDRLRVDALARSQLFVDETTVKGPLSRRRTVFGPDLHIILSMRPVVIRCCLSPSASAVPTPRRASKGSGSDPPWRTVRARR